MLLKVFGLFFVRGSSHFGGFARRPVSLVVGVWENNGRLSRARREQKCMLNVFIENLTIESINISMAPLLSAFAYVDPFTNMGFVTREQGVCFSIRRQPHVAS
jgi:hypothetical protein